MTQECGEVTPEVNLAPLAGFLSEPGSLLHLQSNDGRTTASVPQLLSEAWLSPLTVTVISCLEGGRGLQVAAQGPVTAVAVVEAAVDVRRVLGVGGGWQ